MVVGCASGESQRTPLSKEAKSQRAMVVCRTGLNFRENTENGGGGSRIKAAVGFMVLGFWHRNYFVFRWIVAVGGKWARRGTRKWRWAGKGFGGSCGYGGGRGMSLAGFAKTAIAEKAFRRPLLKRRWLGRRFGGGGWHGGEREMNLGAAAEMAMHWKAIWRRLGEWLF